MASHKIGLSLLYRAKRAKKGEIPGIFGFGIGYFAKPPAAELATKKGHDFVTRNLSGNKMKVSITRKYRSICIRTWFWGLKNAYLCLFYLNQTSNLVLTHFFVMLLCNGKPRSQQILFITCYITSKTKNLKCFRSKSMKSHICRRKPSVRRFGQLFLQIKSSRIGLKC